MSQSPPTVRSRRLRWTELRDLLARLDNLVVHNTQIDALSHSSTPHAKVAEIAAFEADLDRTRAAVQKEIAQLTVDRLRADLQDKKDHRR